MSKSTGALANALRNSGAKLSAVANDHVEAAPDTAPPPTVQASRRTTKAITVHFPEEVRRQLKALAGAEGRQVDDMVAEALNLLFALYRKPEIAPRKVSKPT